MDEWTTPKQVSAAMLVVALATFPQILAVPQSEWWNSLELATACFAVAIPLSAGYLLRAAQMETPNADFWRNLHDVIWVLSVATMVGSVAAAFYHLGEHHATAFLAGILLAFAVVLVGARADGEWGRQTDKIDKP